jgi:hypothetical protein
MWIFYSILKDIQDTKESVRIEYGDVFTWKIVSGITANITYVVLSILFNSIQHYYLQT